MQNANIKVQNCGANFLKENLQQYKKFVFDEHHNFTRMPSPNAQLHDYINNINNILHCLNYHNHRSGIGGQAF